MNSIRVFSGLLLACLLVFATGFTAPSIPFIVSATPTSVWKIASDNELGVAHYAIATDRYVFVADERVLEAGSNHFFNDLNAQKFRDIAVAASLAGTNGEEIVFTGILTGGSYRSKQVVLLTSATISGKVMYLQTSSFTGVISANQTGLYRR